MAAQTSAQGFASVLLHKGDSRLTRNTHSRTHTTAAATTSTRTSDQTKQRAPVAHTRWPITPPPPPHACTVPPPQPTPPSTTAVVVIYIGHGMGLWGKYVKPWSRLRGVQAVARAATSAKRTRIFTVHRHRRLRLCTTGGGGPAATAFYARDRLSHNGEGGE